jgi:hypothetical protein
MSDDLSKKGPADRARINLNESWEVRWWTKELKVTEDELRAAVRAVGPQTADVRKQLSR